MAEANGQNDTRYPARESTPQDIGDPFERIMRLATGNEKEWEIYRSVFTPAVVAHLAARIPKLKILTALPHLDFDAGQSLLEVAQRALEEHYRVLQASNEAAE